MTANDLSPGQESSFTLPENTRRLSIETDGIPLDSISQINFAHQAISAHSRVPVYIPRRDG